jgi:hypothetical protein
MDSLDRLARRTALPRPHAGGVTRVRCGPCDGLLERARGGYAFLWSDGRNGQRVHLGVDEAGELALELAPPRSAVRIVLRDPLVLAPGARVRGYVAAPLVPRLLWRDEHGVDHVLREFTPGDLASEWDERAGHVLVATSPWFARFPTRLGDLRAVVPVRLRHGGRAPFEPEWLPIGLAAGDLTELRGALVTRPRSFASAGGAVVERRRDATPWSAIA